MSNLYKNLFYGISLQFIIIIREAVVFHKEPVILRHTS
jgi:hypothetical protein